MANRSANRSTRRRRARAKPKLKELVGRRFIGLLETQLADLREHRPHGNRTLQFDHVVVAHLLAFFNPCLCSLRDLEDLFAEPRVRKRLGVARMPKSTLSDTQSVFDPQLLLPLIEDLRARVGIQPYDPRLDKLTRELMVVDGTFFTVAPRVAWALYNKRNDPKASPRKGNVRVDVHFDVLRGVPTGAAVSDGRIAEQNHLAASLESGKFYLLDRGFQSYDLLASIVEADSDFLVRQRKGVPFDILTVHPLSVKDRASGVRLNAQVQIPGQRAQWLRKVPLRLIELAPNQPGDDPVQLLTNRQDIPPHLISLLYRHRWQVELFFRWLKCMTNFRHFFSESEDGVTTQVYIAIIGTLLIALQMGAKPSRYDYTMMTMVVSGWIDLHEAKRIMARRREKSRRAAEWQKKYNARKKNQA